MDILSALSSEVIILSRYMRSETVWKVSSTSFFVARYKINSAWLQMLVHPPTNSPLARRSSVQHNVDDSHPIDSDKHDMDWSGNVVSFCCVGSFVLYRNKLYCTKWTFLFLEESSGTLGKVYVIIFNFVYSNNPFMTMLICYFAMYVL